MSVFLSHNHADKDIVRRIGMRLQRLGVPVWIDEAEIRAGESLIQKIAEGIKNCQYLVAFISKNSINAPWVVKELSIAVTRETKGTLKAVIPIILDQVEIPTMLEDKLYIDFSDEKKFQNKFDSLLHALGVPKIAFEVNDSTLESLDFHAAITKADSMITLASAQSTEDEFVFRNPDGIPSYLKDIYIIHSSKLGLKCQHFSKLRLQHSCMVETESHYVVFMNFKVKPGTYDMSGCRWYLKKDSLNVQRVEPIFDDKNWGWFPTINPNLDIKHFSYDGYYFCLNDKKIQPIDPRIIEKEHIDFILLHSNNTIPNSKEYVANKIRSHYNYIN